MLRIQAGLNPHDKSLTDLVGELATRSEPFRLRWARHNVKHHRTAAKRLHNSLVGDIELTGEAMELPGDGLVIITYTAEPGSSAAEALRFLSSWASRRRANTPRHDSAPGRSAAGQVITRAPPCRFGWGSTLSRQSVCPWPRQ